MTFREKELMGIHIGLTGTPGTGKKTVAPMLASELHFSFVSLNELVASLGAPRGRMQSEVDTKSLKRRLPHMLREPTILYGHLLPYVAKSELLRKVVILRCNPSILRERLVSRGYSEAKVTENVEAELIGVVSADAQNVFGESKTLEYDTTTSDAQTASKAISRLIVNPPSSVPRVDWTVLYDTASKLRTLLGEPK